MLNDSLFHPLLISDDNALTICTEDDLKSLRFPLPEFAPYLTTDPFEIQRRQLVFSDLLQHPRLTDLLEESTAKLDNLSEMCRKIGNVGSSGNEAILYSLLELQFYTETVHLLFKGCGYTLSSDLLKIFFETVEKIHSDSQFAALQKLLDETQIKLRRIRSVTVGVNLDAQLNVSEAGIVSINDAPFVTASPLGKLFRKENPPKDYTCIASVGIREIGGLTDRNRIALDQNFYTAMNEILKQSLRNMKRTMLDTVLPSIRSLLSVGNELAFFVKGTRYLEKLQQAKLPLSYPACSNVLSVKDLYNPLLLDKVHHGRIVPSHVTLNDQTEIYVLTGPNSGGKTVYLTAIGIGQIMFQLGLPIPARCAEMRICKTVVTHFTKESAKSTESRLADETIRLRECLGKVTKDSLVLLDEVFSSTSAYDARILAEALLEYLAKIGCSAFYVTHLHELAVKIKENQLSPSIKALSAEVSNGKRTYRITESPQEEVSTSLAHDVVMENGLGFLFE